MTTVPLTQCCRLLAIDSKTLRQWLKQANLSLHLHPTDARIKGLTMEQVQQIATMHGRSITLDALAPPVGLNAPTHLPSESNGNQTQIVSSLVPDPDLSSKLSSLETTVLTLQHQLAQLALELLHEREQRLEGRLQALETLAQHHGQLHVRPQDIQALEVLALAQTAPNQGRGLHPAEVRARSRALPLIEYGADGTYVIISLREGELHFTPDCSEWFDWLATLSSFRFVGKLGRLTAYRNGSARQPSRSWVARRFFHNHNHTRYLGTTPHLTLDRLEQVAADLHSHIASL